MAVGDAVPAHLAASMAGDADQFERYGVNLASLAGAKLRAGLAGQVKQLSENALREGIPPGPGFDYSSSSALFGPRQGSGPLFVAWDTNILIDYFMVGKRLWTGCGPPDDLEPRSRIAMECLELVLALSVVRDVRFVILDQTVNDARTTLSASRQRSRMQALIEFTRALHHTTPGHGSISPSMAGVLTIPERAREQCLEQVPSGADRALVSSATRRGVHVFLTGDRRVLRCADTVRPLGLAILDPPSLIEALVAAGGFHCLLDPRLLTWPMPDLGRVAHLIRALPDPSR